MKLLHTAGRQSIRRQFIVLVTGVHMILMTSFVLDMIERQQAFLLERARSRTLYQAVVLAASSVPQLITKDKAGLQEILQSLSRDSSIRAATVTDTGGRILGDTDLRKVGLYFSDDVTKTVMTGEAKPRIFNQGSTMVSAAAPVVADNALLGWAWVAGDLSGDDAQLAAVRRTGITYIIISIVAGAAFAVVLAYGITKQLRLLLAGTRRLAEDRLEEPVPIVTDNDVGVVAKAFNTAMARLAAERAALVQARNRLEAEVRERRKAEEQLKAANRAITGANENLRQFAYAASHDLQEPLRGIAGYADLLKRRYSGQFDEDADDFINYIHEGAQRMQRLIRALLDYSRAGAGDQPPRPVDCNAALASALRNLETAVEESGAVIRAAELPAVSAHDVAIAQLFQNLVGNAIKYAGPEPPVIDISVERRDFDCLFSVRDNGIGIPPEQHERIFRLFKRAHGSRNDGTGVGLAICNKIVERYAGRIWVESEPGKGATFWFTLPPAEGNVTGGTAEGPRLSLAASA